MTIRGTLTGLNIQNTHTLENTQSQLYSGSGPVENAVRKAVDEIIFSIPNDSRLAIMGISGDPDLSDLIINTLEHMIFST